MTDLFQFADERPQNWRASDPQTSKSAGISTHKFTADHHNAILSVLRRANVSLAAEQISDALGHAMACGRGDVFLDTVQVCKRLAELDRAGHIERTAQTHQNRSGRGAFKVRLKPQSAMAGHSTPAQHE